MALLWLSLPTMDSSVTTDQNTSILTALSVARTGAVARSSSSARATTSSVARHAVAASASGSDPKLANRPRPMRNALEQLGNSAHPASESCRPRRWDRVAPDHPNDSTTVANRLADQRARALVQHQRVMDEAAQVARLTAQARRRAAATPVFASPTHAPDVRQRVSWERAS